MSNQSYAFQLGYDAYKNGQYNNPYTDEKGIMIPELCRYTQYEQGFGVAAEEDLEFEKGIRAAFALIDTEQRNEYELNVLENQSPEC